jgi:peptidase M50-like protein
MRVYVAMIAEYGSRLALNRRRTMRWSLKVGQLAGTAVYVHLTFFVLLAWIGVVGGLQKGSAAAAAAAVGFTTMLFACVVLHEFGHAFMARRFGIRTRDIVLFPFGGVGRLERIPEVPFWCAGFPRMALIEPPAMSCIAHSRRSPRPSRSMRSSLACHRSPTRPCS